MQHSVPSNDLSREEIALRYLEEFHERLEAKDPTIAGEVHLLVTPEEPARNAWLSGFQFALLLIEEGTIDVSGYSEEAQLN